MAVKIRLKKMGTKNRTFFRIVVSDVRAPRDGRVIEELGIYDPIKNPALIKVDKDRALYWLGKGAQPTETVHSILKKEGIIRK
ncbi:MAG: 30S ribosomal protein S16 [Candidatus Omnitrophica bacterium]|nr:30S ribosomal protein S16 [Candidatus Omnitrophota bacterium]